VMTEPRADPRIILHLPGTEHPIMGTATAILS
jgi:hypothetical protein